MLVTAIATAITYVVLLFEQITILAAVDMANAFSSIFVNKDFHRSSLPSVIYFDCVLVGLGHHNKIPVWWLKQKFVLSQSWTLKVPD